MSTMGETGYLIKIAPVLDEGAIGTLEADLRRRIAAIPALQLNVAGSSEVQALSAAVGKVATEVGNLNRAVSETGSVAASRLSEATARADAMASAYQRLAQTATIASDAMATPNVLASQSAVTSEIKAQTAAYREQADYARMVRADIGASGGISNFRVQNGLSKDDMQATLAFMDAYGAKVSAMPSYWQKTGAAFLSHIGQWTLMTAAIEGAALAAHTFQEAVQRTSEFQVQGVLFQNYQGATKNAGFASGSNVSNQELLRDSIDLASRYGDEVNDVSQDIALWTKQTHDYNSALFMTNEALKFQLATGTQIEDFYKTLTGLASQAEHTPLNRGDSTMFNLGETPELMQRVTAAATLLGAGLHQASKDGDEMGSHLNNSAILILEAFDKDAGALSALRYSVSDMVTINTTLIQAFGNSGAAAQEAGDKIQRIIGGIAGLANKPSEIKSLAAEGVNVSNVFNTQGDIIEKLEQKWGSFTDAQRASLSVAISGTRNFDALNAVLDAYGHIAEYRLGIQRNLNAEDHLAADMAGTFTIGTKQLSAEWEGFSIILMDTAMPALQGIIGEMKHAVDGAVALSLTLSEGGRIAADSLGIIGSNIQMNFDPFHPNTYKDQVQKYQDDIGAANAEHSQVKSTVRVLAHPELAFNAKTNPFVTRNEYAYAHPNDPRDSYLNAMETPVNPSSLIDVAKAKEQLEALQRGMTAPPGAGSLLTDPSGKSGSSYPGAAVGDITRQASALDQLDKNQRAVIATDDVAIQTLKLKRASLDDLSAAYRRAINDNEALDNQMKSHASADDATSEHLRSLADNQKPGSKAQESLLSKSQHYAQMAQDLRNGAMLLDSKIQELSARSDSDIGRETGRLDVQKFKGSLDVAGMDAAIASLEKFGLAADGARNKLSAMRAEAERVITAATGLKEQLDTAISDGQQQLLTPGDAAVATFFTDQLKLQKEYTKDIGTARAANRSDLEAEVDQWYAIEEAINRSKLAEAEYARRKSDLEKSPMFGALSTGLNDIGNSVVTSLVNSSNAGLNGQINGLQSQIAYLNNEKNLLLGAQYTGERATIEEELQALTVRENDLKKQEANPPLLKKVFDDVQKSFLGSFVKKLEDDLKGGVIESLLGGDPKDVVAKDADTAAKLRQTIAGDMSDNVKAFAASVSGDNDSFKTGVADFGSYVSNLINAFASSGGGGSFSGGGGGGGISIPGIGSFGGSSGGSADGAGGFSSSGSGGYASSGSSAIGSYSPSAGSFSGGSAPGGGTIGGVASGIASVVALAGGLRGGGNPLAGMSVNNANGVGADGSPAFGTGAYPVPNIKGGSGGGGGLTVGGKLNVGGIMQTLGGVGAAIAGVQEGGFGGALSAGLGTYSALTSSLFSGGTAAFLGTIAPYAAAAIALYSLFAHHDDPAKMPDKYATSDWGQGLADFQGSGYDVAVMNANGQQFTQNSSLRSQLNNESESTFIAKFISSNPTVAKNVLSSRALSLFTGLTPGSGNITGGKDGNLTLSNGQSVFWSDLISEAQTAVGAIEQYDASSNNVNTPIISVNAYGGSGATPSFSPWSTPGINDSDVSAIVQGTYAPGAYSAPSSGSPSGSAGDGGTGGGGSYGGGGAQGMTFTSNVYLDSNQIGQAVNAYRAQRENAGFAANY